MKKRAKPKRAFPKDGISGLEEVRQKIRLGLEQADRGELFEGEAVFREMLERKA